MSGLWKFAKKALPHARVAAGGQAAPSPPSGQPPPTVATVATVTVARCQISTRKPLETPSKGTFATVTVATPATHGQPVPAGAGTDVTGPTTPVTASTDITAPQRAQEDGWTSDYWLAYRDERAAIAEFDGKLPRQQAEARAYQTCIGEWLDRNLVSSKVDDGCPMCGGGDRPGDDLLPVGLGGGEVWLHIGCSAAWRAARIAEAVLALAAMGITGPEGNPP
jgi:hypothetical protein